jgi:hypothetical protein
MAGWKYVGPQRDPRATGHSSFFYAPSGGSDPAFYGWAVILEWMIDEDQVPQLYFRTALPTFP